MHPISTILFDFIQLGPFIFSIIAAILVAVVLGLKSENRQTKKLLLIIALICCIVAALTTVASSRTYTM